MTDQTNATPADENSSETVESEETTTESSAPASTASVNPAAAAHKRRTVRRVITVVVLLIVVALSTAAVQQATLKRGPQPVETSTPTATPAPSNGSEEAQNLYTSTVDAIGGQIIEQFGEDIVSVVNRAEDTDNRDESGNPADVLVATYSNIPLDFDYNSSAQFFIDNAASIGDTWTHVESGETSAGNAKIFQNLKMFDSAEEPLNPAILDITYFTENNETMSVTIAVTVY